MSKLLVICGPTAVGKTLLGIKLAKKFNGEIVSADSRQVYKGMDIGTGKDLPKDSKLKIKNEKLQVKIKNEHILKPYRFGKIPVWLLDMVEPDCQFSVADYVKSAALVIRDIWKRGKLPILVGGTGFYIKAVVDGIETMGVEPDWELREKLSNCQIVKLSNLLKKIDLEKWKRMGESDRRNPRRLIRAIEIAGKIKNKKLKMKKYNAKLKIRDCLFVGLTAPSKILYQRIDKRVDERVKRGVIEEIRNLLKLGYSWKNSVLGETIGYKEWEPYVESSKLRKEVVQRWKYDEHALARRQMTWFKKDKRIFWFDISKKGWENGVKRLIKNWLKKGKELEKTVGYLQNEYANKD